MDARHYCVRAMYTRPLQASDTIVDKNRNDHMSILEVSRSGLACDSALTEAAVELCGNAERRPRSCSPERLGDSPDLQSGTQASGHAQADHREANVRKVWRSPSTHIPHASGRLQIFTQSGAHRQHKSRMLPADCKCGFSCGSDTLADCLQHRVQRELQEELVARM